MKANAAQLYMAGMVVMLVAGNVHAWDPNAKDLGTAVSNADFTEYFSNVSAWLNQKTPSDPTKISESAMRDLLKDTSFVLALDQRQFMAKANPEKLGAFARASDANKKFLGDFLNDAELMDLYLEGGTPRDKDYIGSLGVLRDLLAADPDSRAGMYRRLAIATSLALATPSNAFGSGEPIDPLKRYQHFKAAQKNNELAPMFDDLSVWEYAKVVGSAASDKDLAWAREMLRTMRPELVREAQFIQMAREVKYGKANWGPGPHTMATILNGGGACGPRAWFGRMINEANGVPVWGVKQPGHAAVGFLGKDGWKVMLGRGWDKSTWDGMNGTKFLEIVRAREYATDFSQAEHTRWLADAMQSKEQADALRKAAELIEKNPKGPQTAHRLTPRTYPPPQEEKPWQPVPGVQHLVAADYATNSHAVRVASFDFGQQVYFEKNKECWAEYKVNVPKAETYGITLGHAVANGDCRVRVYVGEKSVGWIPLNNTTGLWGRTAERDIALPQTDTVRFVFPYQRGVAVKWFELKAKGDAPPHPTEAEPAVEQKEEAVDPRNPESTE